MHEPGPPSPTPRPAAPPDRIAPGPPSPYRGVGLVPGAGPARIWGLAVAGVPLLVILLIGLVLGPSGGSDSSAPRAGSAGFGSGTDSSLGGAILPSWTPQSTQDPPDPATTAPAAETTAPATGGSSGTATTTPPAGATATPPAGSTATPPAGATATGTTTADAGPRAVVAAYFDAINNRDYQTAWNLGGSHFADDYDAFVTGFSTTTSDAVTFRSVQGDVVRVYFDAWQTDGTADSYNATFTVSGGEITGGKVTPTT